MRKNLQSVLICLGLFVTTQVESNAQVTLLKDYVNNTSAAIGTFQNINYREAGFSGLFPIPNTNGKEFWTVSDRGVNIDAASANTSSCRPTYDKLYGFPNYAPKIHRIRVNGDSIQILQTITMKRPNGTTATGLLNPAGYGSTATEQASTDTVLNCANFAAKIAPKDIWGIDSEGIVVDKDGNFWICEEGGPSIWKLNPNGVVIKRFTPYANLAGAQPEDMPIDTVFKYRKNNRGFENIAITPNGKIYTLIQSPILYPTKAIGEATRIHRMLEIDPATNTTRMFAYLNDGVIGATGLDQIRMQDWKFGDMAAINDSTFLVLEAAARGVTDIKQIYLININQATVIHSGLYGGVTLEALIDEVGLTLNNIKPVKKTLFMDLLANGWPSALDKAEGLAILNDSTIAICNDNDYGQTSPTANGIGTATGKLSHLLVYGLKGASKLPNYVFKGTTLAQSLTGPSTSQTSYLVPSAPGVKFTSILTAGETVGTYKMAGIPDGLGAFDNGNGTFTVLMNHEIGATGSPAVPLGIVRAHGAAGAFVSRWVISKSDLTVVSGADLIQNVNLWNGTGYTLYNTSNPSPLIAFNRFCSADLPAVSAFYNAATGLGTQSRIFMNGEESGNEGRAFAHVVTGTEAGTSYELPALGKMSFENCIARPFASDKTVVAGTDDTTPGQVYFYIGTKTAAGTEIEKAGLTNGKLYGVKVTGYSTESNTTLPAADAPFTLYDLGDVTNTTGTVLNTTSNTQGVTTFLRPEDGAWDPSNPADFYFVTTNGTTSPSRLWRLRFTDVANPELGGTITAVLEGTEGQVMFDNITIDKYGHVLLVEDVGGNDRLGRTWQYTIASDVLTEIASHDPYRFLPGAPAFLTRDEEATGIIDVQDILGAGMFLVADQAHYSIPGEVVEGGQLLAFYNPGTYSSPQAVAGPSTSKLPYLLPTAPEVKFTSILTAGETVGTYKMAGIPDGLGAFDNGNGTFTVLMNHEIGATGSPAIPLGIVRAHGAAGAFVSKWVISKSDLTVVSGADLIQNVNLWNGTGYTLYSAANPSPLIAFNRFCSADLPAVSAFYNAATGLGTQSRIFMNGEESGNEGRAFAHIVTGTEAGTSYELPALGKMSFENCIARPFASDKTVVAGTDDTTPGQVYFYIGTKTAAGTEIEKAGLTNGKLYGVKVTGYSTESNATLPAADAPFTLYDLGDVTNTTGTVLNTTSNTQGVTTFLRPEDGAWDPSNPADFYFVTTNGTTSPSRLWRLRFTDVATPELGGTITAVLDGTEGQVMFDNIAIDKYGHVLLVEDVGGNDRLGRTWQYTIATDVLKEIASHDPARFLPGAPAFLTRDEEATGIIDVQDILGAGMFLVADQAHYSIPGEVVEGGQLLALYNPDTFKASQITTDVDLPVTGQTSFATLYPNPSGDATTVIFTLEKEEHVVIRIFDLSGREVSAAIEKNASRGEQQIILNTAVLKSGTYVVQVSTDTQKSNIRTVVIH